VRPPFILAGLTAVALFTFGFTGQAGRKPAKRTTQAALCASNLGTGVKTNRQFCDVIIASSAAESVSMTIPARTGAATLMFDLHNRFPVPAANIDPVQAFTSHVAVVAVIKSTGELIERTAVSREYRTIADLFDRITGPARGSAPKNIAPGQPQPVRVTIPAGVTGIGIVGTRIEEWRAAGRFTYDNSRPIAIVSNWRIEYTPR
jgi:hypothetical protein